MTFDLVFTEGESCRSGYVTLTALSLAELGYGWSEHPGRIASQGILRKRPEARPSAS